jgi:hypothetical protein
VISQPVPAALFRNHLQKVARALAPAVCSLMVLAGLIGTAGCGLALPGVGGGSGQQADTSALSASSSTVSFGNVSVGSNSTQSIVFADTGLNSITISTITISGAGFSVKSGTAVTLTSNQTTTITVAYTPTAAGAAQGMLSITSDASNPTINIALSATAMAATSQLSTTSTTLAFGSQTVNTAQVLPVVVTDSGNATVTISAITISGAGFSYTASSNQPLGPNGTVTFSVTFDPKANGASSGTLSISSNATNSPFNISLSGTGVTAPAASSQLTANSTGIGFGSVTVGTTVTKTITLTDSGTANVTISGAMASGSGFSVSGGSNVTLKPNGTANLTISFDPASATAVQGTLAISSNATNSVFTIPLSGTGTAAQPSQPAQSTAPPSVSLNWQASVSQVIGYFVYRGSSATSLSKMFTTALAATNYQDNSVATGQTYYYAVTAVNSSNVESAQTSPVSVTVPSQ